MAAPLDRVKALLAALPRPDQEELTRFLHDILFTPEEVEVRHAASLKETPRRRANRQRAAAGGSDGGTSAAEAEAAPPKAVTYTYRNEWIKCGKEGCRCMEGKRHGPYTYKYWKEDGRLRKAYVGKLGRRERARKAAEPPPSSPAPQAQAP